MIRHGRPPYYDCSSDGDKRFSPFYARLKGCSQSIEQMYQASKVFYGGDTGLSWKDARAKGDKIYINSENVSKLYEALWRIYIDQNPHLMEVLIAQSGFCDKYAQSTTANQVYVLWDIRCEYIAARDK